MTNMHPAVSDDMTIDEASAAIIISNAAKAEAEAAAEAAAAAAAEGTEAAAEPIESAALIAARETFIDAYAALCDAATAEWLPAEPTAEQRDAVAFLAETAELQAFIYALDDPTRLRAINGYRIVETNGQSVCTTRIAGVEYRVTRNGGAGKNWVSEPQKIAVRDKYGYPNGEAGYAPKKDKIANPDLDHFHTALSLSGGRMGMVCAGTAQSARKIETAAEATEKKPRAAKEAAMTRAEMQEMIRDGIRDGIAEERAAAAAEAEMQAMRAELAALRAAAAAEPTEAAS